jgi:hypothetical protein
MRSGFWMIAAPPHEPKQRSPGPHLNDKASLIGCRGTPPLQATMSLSDSNIRGTATVADGS